MFRKFLVSKYEIEIEAGAEGLFLPPYKGSTLRGGFGAAFKKIACSQIDRECKNCLLKNSCPYSYIFETSPPPDSQVLKNYENIPRPFILEPPLETQTYYRPGEKLIFNLILIGRAISYLPYFIVVFRELGRIGIGKGRKGFHLVEVRAVKDDTDERQVIFRHDWEKIEQSNFVAKGKDFFRNWQDFNSDHLTVRFLTMTRLKYEQSFARTIEFHILVRNMLRRISSLYYFHHGLEFEADFLGLIKKAENVKLVSERTEWVDWERFSNRQETKMSLGGVVGEVLYQGDLKGYYPMLKLAELIHVGKGAVFGLGKIQIS